MNHCRPRITTYINGLTENRWTDDTCQSWSIKGYDTGLAEERLTFWRHRKERGINPRPPESIYENDVRPRGQTLLEYSKVPIDQSADPWLATGSRAPVHPDFCHRYVTRGRSDSCKIERKMKRDKYRDKLKKKLKNDSTRKNGRSSRWK